MPLSKFVFIGIGLLFLLIPLNVNSGEFIIYSNEGAQVVKTPEAPVDSSSNKDEENWTRKYAPGEKEREYREALEQERKERREARKRELEAQRQDREERRVNLEKKRLENKRNAIGSWSEGQNLIDQRERELENDPEQYFYDEEKREKSRPRLVIDPETGRVIPGIPLN